MNWFKELLSDGEHASMMRFLSLLCVLIAGYIALRAVSVGADLSAASILCSTFLASGISGKVLQAQIEKKKE